MANNPQLVAIYMRDCPADAPGIEGQRKTIRKWAAQRGMEIYSEYLDSGFSGSDKERPGFQQMLRDAEAGCFQTILVKNMDRFSRDLKETPNLMEGLDRHDVTLVAVNEDLDTSDNGQGRLVLALFAAIDEWERERISRRSKLIRRCK
jgi:site-specific DNA recombinase